ncbi:uncharacterized protein LOC131235058 [Magnolia sinica]|uniref:uncharacterized protein LOC131235058 n=1 Tax=Magnolia sinica TaxID=86752 RepID=UPI002657F868|nr:uncharacterized protein LOC131235058 [Magnolia sinica]
MERSKVRRVVLLLLLGQLMSLFLAATSFTSSLIASFGVNTPLTQSLFTYLLLALVFGSILLYRRQKLQVPWYWYIVLGCIDVQGNYLVIKAYQFSSITSVTLLDCWTIPWVIILTWIFIGTRYSLWQLLGVVISVVGLGLVLLSDAGVSGGGGKKPVLGDVLVIAGTFFYAFSNVGEEYCVKKKDRVEVVAMLGVSGVLFSVIEIFLFERKELESVKWSATIICLFMAFAMSTFLFYTTLPFLLKMSGAALFNLSLLTSDMWAVVIRIFFYRQQVDWLYYLSFVTVALGLIIYSLSEPRSVLAMAPTDEEVSIQYQPLNEENADSRNEVLAN